jgi:primosomal replication protein N
MNAVVERDPTSRQQLNGIVKIYCMLKHVQQKKLQMTCQHPCSNISIIWGQLIKSVYDIM